MVTMLLLSLLAADAKPTVFLDHQLGENISQWFTESHIDLAEICGPHKRSDKRMDYKSACRQLTALRKGADDHFQFLDQSQRTVTWHFAKGTLVDAMMMQQLGPQFHTSTDEQINFLSAIYGPPTHRRTVENRDSFGASWETIEAQWEMPDGSLIQCIERVEINVITRDPSRNLYVTAISRDAARSIQEKSNPYTSRP